MHPVDTVIPLLKNRRERTLAQVSRQIKPPRGRAPCGSLQKWGGRGAVSHSSRSTQMGSPQSGRFDQIDCHSRHSDAIRNKCGAPRGGGGRCCAVFWGPPTLCLHWRGRGVRTTPCPTASITHEARLSTGGDWSSDFHRTVMFLLTFW